MLRRIRRSSTLALLLSPVGVLLLAGTRLLIVSNYNLNTALGILSSGGYVNTLLGTVIPLVPVIMPYLALLLLLLNRVIASLLAFIAALLISPSAVPRSDVFSIARHDWQVIMMSITGWRLAVIIPLAIISGVLLAVELVGPDSEPAIRTVLVVAVIALLPLIVEFYPVPGTSKFYQSFYVKLISQPWLPAETITLTTHQVVVGYALGSDGVWLEVLQANNRVIVYYKMGQVSDRFICQIGQIATARPLVTLIPAQAETPECGQATSPKAPPGVPPREAPPGVPPPEAPTNAPTVPGNALANPQYGNLFGSVWP
jgi:hypothetical protein